MFKPIALRHILTYSKYTKIDKLLSDQHRITDRELFHILLNACINLIGIPEPNTAIQSTVQINHTDSSLNLTAGFKGYPTPIVSVSGATFPLKSLTPQVHTLSNCSQEVGVSVVWGTEGEGERRAANGRQVTWSAGDGISISVTLNVTCMYFKVSSLMCYV